MNVNLVHFWLQWHNKGAQIWSCIKVVLNKLVKDGGLASEGGI